MAAVIAIVGRPNVGKSALFNRIAGKRIAIVHDEPGVTRDRISAEVEWHGQPFTLVDTGGIGLLRREKATDVISRAALQQVELAIEAAQLMIFVVNVQEGVVPLDREATARLRASGKPVLLAINKADSYRAEGGSSEFAELGFERMFPVSAAHGLGIDPLMDCALALLGPEPGARTLEPGPNESTEIQASAGLGSLSRALRLAIIGRPNVGKSSLINALTDSERVIVSPIPGTTRDSVDVPFEVITDGVKQPYVLIDTAGIRVPKRIGSSVEFFSVKRAEQAIARCDIAVLVLDAEEGVTAHDKQVASKIVEHKRACIIVVNKWDLVEGDVRQARQARNRERRGIGGRTNVQPETNSLAEFGGWVQEKLFFLDYAPVVFASAKTAFHLERLLEAIRFVAAQLRQAIPTAILNRALRDAIERQQPVSATGHHVKFFYATQVGQSPPTFLLFVNRAELFSEPYTRFLTNCLRRAFGFEGCPIILVPKPRPKKENPASKRRSN